MKRFRWRRRPAEAPASRALSTIEILHSPVLERKPVSGPARAWCEVCNVAWPCRTSQIAAHALNVVEADL